MTTPARTSDATIFQVTDLTANRVEFVQAARRGEARLRDKDGTSLVMLPESRVRLLEELAFWNNAYLRLEVLLRRGTRPSVSDFGDLAWLRAFDDDDLQEFLSELQDALVAARADNDARTLRTLVEDWRTTAAQLNDPLRRSVLLEELSEGDLVDALGPRTDGP